MTTDAVVPATDADPEHSACDFCGDPWAFHSGNQSHASGCAAPECGDPAANRGRCAVYTSQAHGAANRRWRVRYETPATIDPAAVASRIHVARGYGGNEHLLIHSCPCAHEAMVLLGLYEDRPGPETVGAQHRPTLDLTGPPLCVRGLAPDGRHPRLEEGEQARPGVWVCTGTGVGCPGGETYYLQGPETRTGALVLEALAYGQRRFGRTPAQAPLVWLVNEKSGQAPILPISAEDDHGRREIYLNGQSDGQLAYQASHEVFHTVLTPIRIQHWTHELLATMFSLDFLAASGREAHRAIQIASDEAQAVGFPTEELARVGQPYPPGFYGRLSIFGRQLVQMVGSAELDRLAYYWGPDGQPAYWVWVGEREGLLAISPLRPTAD
jgi:hypothetical protein